MKEKTWKNRPKYGGDWTQADELEVADRELKEAREEEERQRAAKGLPRADARNKRSSNR